MVKTSNESFSDFVVDRVEEIEISVVYNNDEYNELSKKKQALFEAIKKQLSKEYQLLLLELDEVYNYSTLLENKIMYEQGMNDLEKMI